MLSVSRCDGGQTFLRVRICVFFADCLCACLFCCASQSPQAPPGEIDELSKEVARQQCTSADGGGGVGPSRGLTSAADVADLAAGAAAVAERFGADAWTRLVEAARSNLAWSISWSLGAMVR